MFGEVTWDPKCACQIGNPASCKCKVFTVIRNREGKQPESVQIRIELKVTTGMGMGQKADNEKNKDWLPNDTIKLC